MPNFCASCIDGTEGLQVEVIDEKRVLICVRCREADVREYSFDETSSRGQGGFVTSDGHRRARPRGMGGD